MIDCRHPDLIAQDRRYVDYGPDLVAMLTLAAAYLDTPEAQAASFYAAVRSDVIAARIRTLVDTVRGRAG